LLAYITGIVAQYKLDGLDFDWEHLSNPYTCSPGDKDNSCAAGGRVLCTCQQQTCSDYSDESSVDRCMFLGYLMQRISAAGIFVSYTTRANSFTNFESRAQIAEGISDCEGIAVALGTKWAGGDIQTEIQIFKNARAGIIDSTIKTINLPFMINFMTYDGAVGNLGKSGNKFNWNDINSIISAALSIFPSLQFLIGIEMKWQSGGMLPMDDIVIWKIITDSRPAGISLWAMNDRNQTNPYTGPYSPSDINNRGTECQRIAKMAACFYKYAPAEVTGGIPCVAPMLEEGPASQTKYKFNENIIIGGAGVLIAVAILILAALKFGAAGWLLFLAAAAFFAAAIQVALIRGRASGTVVPPPETGCTNCPANSTCQNSVCLCNVGFYGSSCESNSGCAGPAAPQMYSCAGSQCAKSTCSAAGDECFSDSNCGGSCSTSPSSYNIDTFDETTFKTIFPILDENSWAFSQIPAISGVDARTQYPWSAGYKMWRTGAFASFIEQAKKFTGFADGPNGDLNKLELAAFFGNVIQETGESNFGLTYSMEGTPVEANMNDMSFGRGALQLTGTSNYYDATFGTFGQDPCSDPSQACWNKCNTDAPVAPPLGSGFNLCSTAGAADAGPFLASQNAGAGWASALAYWMNRPLNFKVCEIYSLTNCSPPPTSHDLIQRGSEFGCDDWCAVMTAATTGCPSCCTTKQTLTPADSMTINRIKHIVNVARILGYSGATSFSAAGDFYCKLINACGSSNNCDTINYDCLMNNSCAGNLGLLCGGVRKTTGDNVDCAPDESCWPCVYQNATWYPCTESNLCKWNSPA
jgi:hypothetical protein